jgi:hypothetical protein
VVDSGGRRTREAPLGANQLREGLGEPHADVEVAGEQHRLVRGGEPVHENSSPQQLRIGHALVGRVARRVEVPDQQRAVAATDANRLAHAPLTRPGEAGDRSQPEVPRLRTPESARVQGDLPVLDDRKPGSHEDCIRLTGEGGAEEPVVKVGKPPSDLRRRRERPEHRPLRDVCHGGHPAPVVEEPERPDGQLLQAEDIRSVGACQPHHLFEEGSAPGRLGVAVEEVPGPDKQAHYCTRT